MSSTERPPVLSADGNSRDPWMSGEHFGSNLTQRVVLILSNQVPHHPDTLLHHTVV